MSSEALKPQSRSETLLQIDESIEGLEIQMQAEDLSEQEMDALIDAWLLRLGDIEEKIDGYAAVIRKNEATAKFREEEAKRLNALADRNHLKVERMKARLIWYMDKHKKTEFSTPLNELSVGDAGGVRALIYPPEWKKNPALAPPQFQTKKEITELDTAALKTMAQEVDNQVAPILAAYAAGEIDDDACRRLIEALPLSGKVFLAPRRRLLTIK